MKLLITGDFSPQERIVNLIDSNNTDSILADFKDHINDADLNITNLETSIVYSGSQSVKKTGRNIGNKANVLVFLKQSGFNLVTLANNHFMDYGSISAEYAFNKLKESGLEYIGAGTDETVASLPFIYENDNLSVGIINACEHEFIGKHDETHCNTLDPIPLIEQIESLKERVNHIILIFHGGDEHSSIPRPNMVRLYRFLIDRGASIILNHHQHCIGGYENYHKGVIFYGLGNFCFDKASKRNSAWNYGYAVKLEVKENSIDFQLIPYSQCNNTPTIKILKGKELNTFNKKLNHLNQIIGNEDLLKSEYDKWLKNNKERYISYLSPYGNKYLRFLVRKGLIPSFIKGNHARVLFLMNSCESHRDAICRILEDKI